MKPQVSTIWTGRCLCGTVRYAVEAAPARLSLCHCEDCRRASGAPAVGWVFFPARAFRWTQGEAKTLAWTGRIRTFCGQCGSPLTFTDPALQDWIEVTAGTLDEPHGLTLHDHNWEEDRLPWLQTADHALRFDRSNPELPPLLEP